MKPWQEYQSINKIHSCVQQMLAQARQIPCPSLPPVKSSNQRIDLRFSPSKINQHLRQLLRKPSQQYRKIDRSKHYSFRMEEQKPQKSARRSNLMSMDKLCSIRSVEHTNRYDRASPLGEAECQLLDKRQKRKLYNKKTVNLLPQLPLITKNSVQNDSKIREVLDQFFRPQITPRYYSTISEKDLQKSEQNADTVKQSNTISPEEGEDRKITLNQIRNMSKYKRSLLFRCEQPINPPSTDLKIKKIKAKINTNRHLFESISIRNDSIEPEPWQLDRKQPQLFDVNNF